MAWDDTRHDGPGNILYAEDWNAMITDQKSHKFRHGKTGTDPITPEDIGAASDAHIHDTIDGGNA